MKKVHAVDFGRLNRALTEELEERGLGRFKYTKATIGDIISNLLKYIFVLAGLALLVYLILGGFQLMTSGGDPKAVSSAKDKITNALLGFIIIFVAYWLMQIIQTIFGFPGPF